MIDFKVNKTRAARGQIVLVKQVVVEIRAFDIAAGLTGEMVNLA